MARRPPSGLRRAGSILLMTLIVSWSFGPILIAIVSSFKHPRDIFTYVPTVIFEPTLNNYAALIGEWSTFWRAMGNSIIVTLGAALVVVLTSIPAAYAYSRLARPVFALSALFLIAIRMFPPIIVTIPLFPILTRMGLTDTPVALVFVYSAFMVSISVLLLKNFLDAIPREIDEAAMLDGATRVQTFIRITLPQIAPGIAASVIFVTLFAWNDFTFAFILAGTGAKTGPVILTEMMGAVGEGAATWGIIFAASVAQLAPILLFVWLIQKPLLRGFSASSGR